jgi:hypothetical protein
VNHFDPMDSIMTEKGDRDEKVQDRAERDREREERDKDRDEKNRDRAEIPRDGDDDITRINFTVPKRMKEQWQDMAKEMATSISQLIRNAVQAYGKDIDKDLKDAGSELEQAGREIEKAFQNVGLDDEDTHDNQRREPSFARTGFVGHERVANPLDQLRKLKELLDLGAITDDEYKAKKAKLLDMV